MRHAQLQLPKGTKCIFTKIMELKGLRLESLFQNIPIHSLILSTSMLLKGLISTIINRSVGNTGAGGVFACKRIKRWSGI